VLAEPALVELAASGSFIALSFVLGALFGSFANVCIVRLPPTDDNPSGMSVVSPGSRCMACGTPLKWFDNLPILSYLILRGRCRKCRASYSARYLIVELVMALLFLAAYYHSVLGPAAEGDTLLRWHSFGILAAFSFTLVVITFIDLDHKLILNKVTYPAIPLFYLAGISLPGAEWSDGLIGVAVGYGIIRLLSDGYYYATGREGLGYGDGKLLAIVGALYGWRGVVVTLFVGSLLGSVISIAVLSLRRRSAVEGEGETDEDAPMRHVEVPFGPFLAAGALVYAFALPWISSELFILWR